MEFRILDKEFNTLNIIDTFESVLWTMRIAETGDFELYTPVTNNLLNDLSIGNYFFSELFYNDATDTAALMFIETVEIESDVENGSKIKATGRDLKSILDRRIVWTQTSFKASVDTVDKVVETLLNEAIINPQDWTKTYQSGDTGSITITVLGADRKIDNFVFIKDENETYPALLEDVQYEGDTLYEAFKQLCENYNIGFNILYNFTTGNFEFHLIKLRDRSFEQHENVPIIFSSAYENLRSSNYIISDSAEKTVGLVVGEGDELNRMYNVVGSGSGLYRKEMNISASDISRTKEDGTEYGNATYLSMLKDKGNKELNNNKFIKTYEGSVETSKGFNYPGDFDIGDVVEIVNEYDISSKVLISEIILSISANGYSVTPTFAVYEEEPKQGGE